MPIHTPVIPNWIRDFRCPGYTNVYSLHGLHAEPKLYCTETLLGDWGGQTLLLAKDAAPTDVIQARIDVGDPNPWRHGVRGRDRMGYLTNERVWALSELILGGKLYGSALAHLLKTGNSTSNTLSDFFHGPLFEHVAAVLRHVTHSMQALRAVVCLGKEAHRLVSLCSSKRAPESLQVGECCVAELFDRPVIVGRLHHPSRPFQGGWSARHAEWNRVASSINQHLKSAQD